MPKTRGNKMLLIPEFYTLSTKTSTLVWNKHLGTFQTSGDSEFPVNDSKCEDLILPNVKRLNVKTLYSMKHVSNINIGLNR